MSHTDLTPPQVDAFVRSTIARCQEDKGLAARLRRADNPATEYQCWDYLAAHDIDLEAQDQRLIYSRIVAAIAKRMPERDGTLTLGRALAACYEDRSESAPGKARLRRLLACHDLEELCLVLRPVLSLIASRTPASVNFTALLKQLRRFRFDPQQVKAEWARDFYAPRPKASVAPNQSEESV